MRPNLFSALAAAMALAGCATLIEGTTQEVSMDVLPSGAECSATQWGREVGRYSAASRNIFVPKSRHDLIITCSAPGHRTKEVRAVSEVSGWGIASILVWDFGLTDYATGALNKYPNALTVYLERDEGVAQQPATAQPPVAVPAPSRAASGARPGWSQSSAFPPVTSSGTR